MAVLTTGPASATTRYHLKARAVPMIAQRLAFALTCSDSSNSVLILNAEHDGQGIVTATEGGPFFGRLVGGYNPADTTIMVGGEFYSELEMLFQGFNQLDCDIELTEQAPSDGSPPSQFALYWRDQDGRVRSATDDPLGTDAIVAIDITGNPGGALSVFYPLEFVAPDTLLLAGDVVHVSPRQTPRGILSFAPVSPNPTQGVVQFIFELAHSGSVALAVYDVAGRVMFEPLRLARSAGVNSAGWNLRGRSGTLIAPGVYVAELRVGQESCVRRFVVTR